MTLTPVLVLNPYWRKQSKNLRKSYTDRIVRMAEETKVNKAEYRSLAHVCPTSVMVERLFSDAKHIMTDDRRHMDPSTLDMLLFLKKEKGPLECPNH